MITAVKQFFSKKLVCAAMMMTLVFAMSMTAFAGTPAPATGITTDMLTPVLDAIIANVGVIIPVGIGIFAIMIGIRMVPRLFNWFTQA